MELRFIQPELRRLDLSVSEVLVLPVVFGQRPPRGTLGLVDYRLGGRISELLRAGRIEGRTEELLLLSGRPKLPFDKLLLLGVGTEEDFSPRVYTSLVELLLAQLGKLGVRRAVVELPGRANGWIGAEEAAERLLEVAAPYPDFDVWTLIDTPEASRAVLSSLKRDRSREWGVNG